METTTFSTTDMANLSACRMNRRGVSLRTRATAELTEERPDTPSIKEKSILDQIGELLGITEEATAARIAKMHNLRMKFESLGHSR